MHMMVANGMLEQVRLQVHTQSDLCAAKMLAVRCFDGFGFSDEIAIKFWTSPFK